jgi:hypothetical protein
LVALVAAPAGAAAPNAQGWWWLPQQSTLPAGLPAPPGVPADGLYIASNPSGAEALAAVRFLLPAGATAGPLTLKVSGDVRGTPVVAMCAITVDWQPAQGGPWSSRPTSDCSPGVAVAGTMAADGKSLTFGSPGRLVSAAGVLDVALVPGVDAAGANTTFQLTLARPDASALEVRPKVEQSEPPPDAGPLAPSTPGTATPTSSGSPAGGGGSIPSTAAFVPAPDPIASGLGSAEPAVEATGVPTPSPVVLAPVGQAPRAAPVSARRSGNQRQLGWIGLVGAAITYHRLSMRTDRPPRSLIAFGQGGHGPGGSGQPGGDAGPPDVLVGRAR